MAIYLLYMASPCILFIFLELLTNQKIHRIEQLKNTYLILFVIIMTAMVGLRHPGNGSDDTMFYYRQWEELSGLSLDQLDYYIKNMDMEVGYLIVVWLGSHIFQNGQWLLLLSGLFFAVSICVFVKRNCKNMVLALAVFNCLGLFNFMVQGLRQSIAMCICLWALEPCKQKRPVRFLLMIGLAALFHASAVIFAIVYLLGEMRFDLFSVVFFICGVAVAIMLIPRLFEIMNKLLNDDYSLGTGSEEGGWIAVLILLAIIVFGLAFQDKRNPHYPMYIYMTIVGLGCMLLRQSVSPIVERASNYFAYAEMVIVANSVSSIRDKRTQVLVCVAVFALCFFVAVHKTTYSSLIPYRFFWNI